MASLLASVLGFGACSGVADNTPHGVALDLATTGTAPGTDGSVIPLADGGMSPSVLGSDGGTPVTNTLKLSTSLYCPKIAGITPKLFYTSDTAVEAVYDAWLAGQKGGSAAYAAPPLDILGTRVRPGEVGNGSTVTTAQLEGQKITCGRIPSKAGPGAFETTTLAPDPTGKPVCLLQGMDWGTDFHYTSASFPMRAVCLGAPTTFAFKKNFDNDAFPTAIMTPAGGVGAFVSGSETYAFGYSTAFWADASQPAGQRASQSTTYTTTLTATNATGSFTTPALKYRFDNINDLVNGGNGGIARHPSDNTCLIKSAGEKGNNVEGQVAIKNGQVWAIRVMLVPSADGMPGQFQWVLWGDTEFALGPMISPYAVISDLPCEFDQIVDGCYSDSTVISYYPGSPVYVNDLTVAKAQGKRYCAMKTDQVYYMNVRSQSWLAATPSDDCAAGSTCTFGAFFKTAGP